jgi:predicted aldo/keto reductase-like oxidoreductase
MGRLAMTKSDSRYPVFLLNRVLEQTPSKVLDAAYEAGCTFWDTADRYADSEDLIGKWFANVRRLLLPLFTYALGSRGLGSATISTSPPNLGLSLRRNG